MKIKTVNICLMVLTIGTAGVAGALAWGLFSGEYAGVTVLNVFRIAHPGYAYDGEKFVWCPGVEHPHHAHVYAAAVENAWKCKDGYMFASADDFEVKWIGGMFVGARDYVKTGSRLDEYFMRKKCDQCAGTGKIEIDCAACDGKGVLRCKVDCASCHKGLHVCRECYGGKEVLCTGRRGDAPCGGKCNAHGCRNGKYDSGNWGVFFNSFASYLPSCSSCKGGGTCDKCQGTRKYSCIACDENGQVKCRECKGSGSVEKVATCNECNGSKSFQLCCPKCEGVGFRWECGEPSAIDVRCVEKM